MPVPEQTPYIEYTANGTTTVFPLGFDCDNSNFLVVSLDEIEAPVGSWSFNNGSVIFNTAPANGVLVSIKRNTPFQRTTNYQSYDNSFRPSPVNRDFDLIWWKLQELGYRDQVIWLALIKEISDRIDGDENLQNQINTIDEWLSNLQGNVDKNTADISQLILDLSQEVADRIANDKILKDMFLAMMDEAINEGTINALAITHVDSLEDLEEISNVWDGRTVYVKNTGNYAFDAALSEWIKSFQDADNVRDGEETQKAINAQSQYSVSTFSELRALKYKSSKHKKGVFVCQRADDYKFGGGLFVPDLTDTTTADDDGTILVGLNGVRWKRKWNAHADPCWFGADYKGLVDCSPQVQKAIDVSYGRLWFGNADRNFKMMTPVGLPTNSIVGDMLMEICGAGARIWVYSDTGIFTSKRSIGFETSNSDLYTAVLEIGRGLRFQGDGTSPSVVINGDRLYNVNMKGGRYLRNTALVKATIPRRSENTGYLQSVTIEGNHLALCRKIIDSKRGFNINFNRNFGESCYGGLYIDGEGAPAVNVVRCEGNLWESGGVFAKLGATYAGTFFGNYFEGNSAEDVPILKCMIELGKTGTTQYSSGVTFIGNQFGASTIYKTDPEYCDVKFSSALSGTGLDNITPPIFIGNWTNGYRMWSEGQVLTQFGNTFSGGSARRHGAPKLHTEARVTFDLSRKDYVSATSLSGGVHTICELETSLLEAITAQANRACSADLNIFMQMKTSNNIVLGSALAKISLLAQGAEGISVGAVNSVYVGATLTGFTQLDGGLIDSVNNISLFKHFTNPVLTLQRVGTKYQLKLSGYAPLTGTIYGDTVKISSNSIMTIYSLNSGGSLAGQIAFS